jgi:hypothetical protein
MGSLIRFEPVETVVHGAQEARLVFVGGKLGAVIVKLDEKYGDLAHIWYAEAAFEEFERMTENTFSSLDAIATWMEGRVKPATAA